MHSLVQPQLRMSTLRLHRQCGVTVRHGRQIRPLTPLLCRAEAEKATTVTTAPPTESAPAPVKDSKSELMAKIKSYGVAGTLSYVVTEIAFWAIALPGAYFGYHQTTGQWLSLETDRAQLVGLAAAFVTGVRFAVPLRMGTALALVPTMKKLLDGKQQ